VTEQNDNLETLVRRSLTGDQRAYASLLHETTRLLRPFLAKRLSIANEVDDLMQEILLSIHKARHTYDGNRPYRPWVYAIAAACSQLRMHLQHHTDDAVAGSVGVLLPAQICQHTLPACRQCCIALCF
jgi:RNA polymerase sigma-70 factor (ECF subfamily)